MRYAQFKPSYVPWVLVMVLLVMLVYSQVYWGAEVSKAEEAALTLEAAIPALVVQRDLAVSEREAVTLRMQGWLLHTRQIPLSGLVRAPESSASGRTMNRYY